MQCFNEGGESEFSNVMICETKGSHWGFTPADVVLFKMALEETEEGSRNMSMNDGTGDESN